jgi:hypothetical protein
MPHRYSANELFEVGVPLPRRTVPAAPALPSKAPGNFATCQVMGRALHARTDASGFYRTAGMQITFH